MAADIFKAGMQIQVINASMENMETYMSNNDEKKALEMLRLNKKECLNIIEIAKKAADLMRERHL